MAICTATSKDVKPIFLQDPYVKALRDEEDGLWLVDVPYAIANVTPEEVSRAYLSKDLKKSLIRCNDPLIVPWQEKHGTDFYLNGKPLPKVYPPEEYKGKVVVNPPKEISMVSSIDKYCDEWYDLFYLVCGRLKGLNLEDWFSKSKPCTKIGGNIATAMVKVAATRIFNEPEQSVVEVISNSVDSYASLVGKPKVGRFGMGFFSLLYHLVKHPRRCLYILTTTFDKSINTYTTVYLRIREIDESLMFSLRVVDTKTSITGTMVHLDTTNDPLTVHEADKFYDFTLYTSMIDSVPIVNATLNEMVNQLPMPKSPKGAITITHDKNGLKVTDQAGGMSLDVIINSLLIPSISTKGIKVSTQAVPYDNYSTITNGMFPKFIILINKVIIVSVRIPRGTYNVYLSLPSSAVLPVTRDDVIIESVRQGFTDSLNVLVRLCIAKKDVTILENALNAYRGFTANIDNRQFIDKFIAGIYKSLQGRVIITKEDEPIYKYIYPDYLIGTRINANTNESILIKKVPGDATIFANKRVVLMPKNSYVNEASSGSTYSYLFIPYDTHSKKEWENSFPMSCKFDYISLATAPTDEIVEVKKLTASLNIKKYSQTIVHLYTTIKNAFIVKVNPRQNPIEVYYVYYYKKMCDLLEYLLEYLGEDYMFETINRWMYMVGSIAEPTNYGSGKRRLFNIRSYTPKKLYLGRKTIDVNTLPNFPRLIKEYHNIMFEYNTHNNQDHRDNAAVMYPVWPEIPLPSSDYYMYNVFTKDFSWIEAALGEYVLTQLSRNKDTCTFRNDLENSPAFYNQIKLVYNKYLRGKENIQAIFENNWAYMPMYAGPAKDLTLWCKMFVTATEMPKSVLKMEITPQFTAKQLINYVFKHDTVDFSRLPYESKDLLLQVLEISINAGTTKPFIEATLTELIQNSMDAIRLVDPPKKTVDVKTTKIGKGLIAVTIQDYVGMTLENIVAISIPFYSNKKASELVTGEMGTGFFNVYRESVFVLIDTVRDGQGSKFIQVPQRDDKGDVYDIISEMAQGPTSRERGTGITFVVRCTDENDELNVYNRVFSFVNEVIGLMDFDGIFFNGIAVKKEKRLIYRLDELECYYCDNAPISYVLTKGVPFYPLFEFFSDKSDIGVSVNLLEQFQNNVIINIRHGFYTPVQSRTRLNIEPENLKKLNTFLFNGLARAMYERVYLLTVKYPNPDITHDMEMSEKEFLNGNFRDWKFDGDIRQVVPTQMISEKTLDGYEIIRKKWNSRSALLYYLLPGPVRKVTNFQSLIARASEKGKNKSSLNAELEKIYTDLDRYSSAPDEVVLLGKVKACLSWWMALKNTEKELDEEVQIMKLKKPPPNKEQISVYVQKMVDYTVKVTQDYVNIFIRLANKYTKDNPRVVYPTGIVVSAEITKPGVGAYYQKFGKKLVLGGVLKNLGESLSEFVNDIPRYIADNGTLRGNEFYQTLFGYQEPCSAVVHEIEHARRGGDHDQVGTHDDVTISLFGNASRKYIYSDVANTIYLKLVSDGLISQWLNAIKGYKI